MQGWEGVLRGEEEGARGGGVLEGGGGCLEGWDAEVGGGCWGGRRVLGWEEDTGGGAGGWKGPSFAQARAMCEEKVHQYGENQPRGHFRAREGAEGLRGQTKRREDMSEGKRDRRGDQLS